MELNIKGTPEEIQKVFQAIAGSEEHLYEYKKDIDLRIDRNDVAQVVQPIIHDMGLNWKNMDDTVYRLNPKLAHLLDDENPIKKPNN